MAIRKSSARWNGTLKVGSGVVKFGDYEGPFTFASRFEEGDGTNPEELVGAAHAGCFSMFLAALLSADNLNPQSVETTATVHLGKDDTGPKITHIDLNCKVKVSGLDEASFNQYSAKAKANCPISRLFAGTEINLSAQLV
jgi:osmotically inducible protein OsmC